MIQKVQNWGDDRNKGTCVHCGGPNETRDHAPSLIFLDDPLPDDLPTSPSCARCNQGFSNDELYLATLLECVLSGSTAPDSVARDKVANIMRHRPSLVAEIAAARREEGGQIVFGVDHSRVAHVVLKLARCHVAYELNEPRIDPPKSVSIKPLSLITAAERHDFENGRVDLAVWPEIGSRAMNRVLIADDEAFSGGWLHVQSNRYRFRTSQDDGLRVRIAIRDYLACDVRWD